MVCHRRFLTRPALSLVALAALVSTGCSGLDFDRQTVFVGFPSDQDEVRALLVYEGLHVCGDKPKDLDSAKKQLKELFATNRHFHLGYRLVTVSLEPFAETEEVSEADKQLKALVQKHLTIRKGEFFLNKDGKLCAWKTVTVREARKFVDGLNERITDQFTKLAAEGLRLDRSQLSDVDKKQWEKWDMESLEMLYQARDGRHPWLLVEPGRISFTLLGTPHLFRHLKREALGVDQLLDKRQWLLDAKAKNQPGAQPANLTPDDLLSTIENQLPMATFLSDNPWSLHQRKNHLTIALGVDHGEPFRLTFGRPHKDKRKFDDELLKHARTLPVKFSDTATTDSLIADLQKELGAPPRK